MTLTKLTLVLFLLVLTTNVSRSQNMTVTLGTGGVFTIKDTSNNFLTLNQSNGQVRILSSLRLEKTINSSTIGVIFKGADRFMHDFKPTGADGNNTFVGRNSGNFTMSGTGSDASYNTAVGYYSLGYNTTGRENTAMGFYSLWKNTTGHLNTAMGCYSLRDNTSGTDNTSVGYYSLVRNTTGLANVSIGGYSLYNNTTGNLNTALGHSTGSNISTGSNLTCLGYDAEPTTGSATNQITLGNNQITSLRCNVTTITSLSDARDKKNIRDLNLGLDFLMNVKPRLFNWDRREWYENDVSDGSKIQETPTAGFVAQELDEVQQSENAEWLNLVLKDNPEKLEATPGNLLPIMVKAIQELKIENDELKEKNNELEKKNDKLDEKLSKFEQMQSYLVSEIEKLKSKEGEILKTSSK